ncbi:hypothetical protein V8C42DRAFT_315411 [Trichoderma barbatum]
MKQTTHMAINSFNLVLSFIYLLFREFTSYLILDCASMSTLLATSPVCPLAWVFRSSIAIRRLRYLRLGSTNRVLLDFFLPFFGRSK